MNKITNKMEYIWYKNRVSGPFMKATESKINTWKTLVDSMGEDTPFPFTEALNDEMKEYPLEAHIICKKDET
jgi:hypothetical protein